MAGENEALKWLGEVLKYYQERAEESAIYKKDVKAIEEAIRCIKQMDKINEWLDGDAYSPKRSWACTGWNMCVQELEEIIGKRKRSKTEELKISKHLTLTRADMGFINKLIDLAVKHGAAAGEMGFNKQDKIVRFKWEIEISDK
jgi:hypothetical protein